MKEKPSLSIAILDDMMGPKKHGGGYESPDAAPDSDAATEGEEEAYDQPGDVAACLDRMQSELDQLKASLMR